MIATLRGKVLERGSGRIVIDVGGVGYLLAATSAEIRMAVPEAWALLHFDEGRREFVGQSQLAAAVTLLYSASYGNSVVRGGLDKCDGTCYNRFAVLKLTAIDLIRMVSHRWKSGLVFNGLGAAVLWPGF
jgi:hypothetical protein